MPLGQGLHTLPPLPGLRTVVPAAQAVHALSLLAVGARTSIHPGRHTATAWHSLSDTFPNVFAGHCPTQMPLLTNSPGGHTVQSDGSGPTHIAQDAWHARHSRSLVATGATLSYSLVLHCRTTLHVVWPACSVSV